MKASFPSLEFYQDNSNLKWIILAVSIIISAGSVYFTDILVGRLKERERDQVKLFARALEYTINNNDILFITEEIISKNNSIPTINTNSNDSILYYNNLDVDSSWSARHKQNFLRAELADMKQTYPPIEIVLKVPETQEVFGKQYVYYKNSFLLTQLTVYPYIQLLVLAIFGFISYLAFSYSRRAEQDRVWVGLTKETAHQLGTPISSLMAWIEVLRDDPEISNKGIIEELDKDIKKLQMVTERF
ncbi:MAG TPA: histidine kinase, partial [Cytophagales bacterium]|nr:histidine kinase [Cytophagales bacterium]